MDTRNPKFKVQNSKKGGAWKPVAFAFCILHFALLLTLSASESLPPLLAAVKRGDHADVQVLLRDRAAVNQPQADGTTALHWAVQNNDLELMAMLLRAGADVKAENRYGIRPIALAATNGSAGAIEALLKAGADPNTATHGGEPVL